MDKQQIEDALKSNNYYVQTTAKSLGIGRTKLYNLISQYEIQLPKPMLGAVPIYKINNTKVNNTYGKMLARCYNPKNKNYEGYGGRGISVYPEWVTNRDAFAEYIMALENFGVVGYSLDRIDNDKGYEPGNLRYATRFEQSNNTRRNRIVTYEGVEYTLAEFCRKVGLGQNFVIDRLKLGFTMEEVINVPLHAKRKSLK